MAEANWGHAKKWGPFLGVPMIWTIVLRGKKRQPVFGNAQARSCATRRGEGDLTLHWGLLFLLLQSVFRILLD